MMLNLVCYERNGHVLAQSIGGYHVLQEDELHHMSRSYIKWTEVIRLRSIITESPQISLTDTLTCGSYDG